MMLVSLITPHLDKQDALSHRVRMQQRFFQTRGHKVVIYTGQQRGQQTGDGGAEAGVIHFADARQRNELADPHLLASDLLVFHAAAPYPLLEMLPKLERGAAVLYFHLSESPTAGADAGGQEGELSRSAAYADLVVAEGEAPAAALVNFYGYTALPVHVLPISEETTPEEYAIYWAEAVAAATAWLPNRPYAFGPLPPLAALHPPARAHTAVAPSANSPVDLADQTLMAHVQQLISSASTMQHDYVVGSRVPLVGPLLAWLRRNLTSHLREPYIDPTFQRQERFNQQAAKTIMALLEREATIRTTLEERIAELEGQVQALTSVAQTPTEADHEETQHTAQNYGFTLG